MHMVYSTSTHTHMHTCVLHIVFVKVFIIEFVILYRVSGNVGKGKFAKLSVIRQTNKLVLTINSLLTCAKC